MKKNLDPEQIVIGRRMFEELRRNLEDGMTDEVRRHLRKYNPFLRDDPTLLPSSLTNFLYKRDRVHEVRRAYLNRDVVYVGVKINNHWVYAPGKIVGMTKRAGVVAVRLNSDKLYAKPRQINITMIECNLDLRRYESYCPMGYQYYRPGSWIERSMFESQMKWKSMMSMALGESKLRHTIEVKFPNPEDYAITLRKDREP